MSVMGYKMAHLCSLQGEFHIGNFVFVLIGGSRGNAFFNNNGSCLWYFEGDTYNMLKGECLYHGNWSISVLDMGKFADIFILWILLMKV